MQFQSLFKKDQFVGHCSSGPFLWKFCNRIDDTFQMQGLQLCSLHFINNSLHRTSLMISAS